MHDRRKVVSRPGWWLSPGGSAGAATARPSALSAAESTPTPFATAAVDILGQFSQFLAVEFSVLVRVEFHCTLDELLGIRRAAAKATARSSERSETTSSVVSGTSTVAR